jgi:hypothetical protein
MVPIREDFQDCIATRWLRPTVERLLRSLSSAHTHELSAILLTNSMRTMRRNRGRSSRRNRRGTPIGRYHPPCRGERGWVELIVDRIVADMPKPLLQLQLARDLVVARVLYHELGHHLDETVGPAARGGESSAEAWRRRLFRLHARKRYWYLRPFVRPIRALARILNRVASRRRLSINTRSTDK